ncbi:type IV secretion system DNA-binding domain-containing protein [Acidipila sp. EB88]|uniref:type IV secretion system DNA-binding domain-containing protein n=1 Tax=Acidipila sp. EB88 TaxID=2305226 RepID=UPI000F5EA5A5|nr:type IV secretion system DNA-binding domain-containing protein [Acidipila sp. EB88]RRA50459.1 ArsR family transcriptional regulator [Acidipila sp. EB88]
MSTWGRKETVVWPPHQPIYSYGAVILSLVCCLVFVVQHYYSKTPAERYYAADYARASAGAMANQHGKYRLLMMTGPKRTAHIVEDGDLGQGPWGFGFGPSDSARAAGYSGLTLAAPAQYQDARLAAWFRAAVFHGDTMLSAYALSLIEGGVVLIGALALSMPADVRRFRQMKYGRLLKGPVMLTPKQFNDELKGSGLGIRTLEQNEILRIPAEAEAKHIQVMGDTGAGKTTLLFQMLCQIRDRGDSAIVYDPAGEFTERFYDANRGDVVLNPLDARCPYWTPSSEMRNPAEATTIAKSLYQPTNKQKGEFFTETPQKIFARLLLYRPTPRDLAEWMANPDEIDQRVEGTPMKAMIAKSAQQQRSGVLASLGLVADGLMMLPTREAAEREWSAAQWAEKRQGWIFLTGKESEKESLRPLHSLWIDLLILRLLDRPEEGQKRAWFVLDEVASLQRLPQFHEALTKGRKGNNPIIFGFQGKAQIEDTYGQLAEVMLSQPATKFILRTDEPKAAKWASELIGEREIERVRETVSSGKRQGKSFTMDRQVEPLVLPSEIKGLADLHAFVKTGNHVSRFRFPHVSMPVIAKAFEPREKGQETLWLEHPGAAEEVHPAIRNAVRTPAEPLPVSPAPLPLDPEENSDELVGSAGL